MSDVLVFTPKHELDFQRNYDEFISFAKNELSLFSEHEFDSADALQKGWNCDKWSWDTSRGKKLTIVFGVSENIAKYRPYKQPFSDFAKGYVRYQQSLNHKDSTAWASSLVLLYQALEESAQENDRATIDVMNISNSVINRVEELITKSSLAQGSKRNLGLSFQKLVKFIIDMKFKLDLQHWTNPIGRPKDNNIKLDENSRSEQLEKCPSDYQMLQVADAFHKAHTPRQRYFSSLCVMLMCQPSRKIELNGLTIDSLQKTDSGKLYLMWHPAKGGDPVKKWVPELLSDVVQQAFDILVEISAPARAAAKYAHDNPEEFMIHDQCSTPNEFSQSEPLTYNQFANAMAFKTGKDTKGVNMHWGHSGTANWLKQLISKLNGVTDWKKELLEGKTVLADNQIVTRVGHKPTDIKVSFPSYADLRTVVNDLYITKEFPKYGDRYIWENITLIRDNEFRNDIGVKPFSWVMIGHGALNDAIGSDRKVGNSTVASIFQELGISDEDGSSLQFTSKQFRHWLNTKLMLAGEEDWLIAKWSGRADIKQNKAYDGRTRSQKSRLTQRIGFALSEDKEMTVAEANQILSSYSSESPPPPLVLHELELPLSLKSLGVDRIGVAQFNGLGYCVHNYAESPCVKSGDCAVCSENVCLKGLPNSLEELKSLESLQSEQLEQAKIDAGLDVFGADRWVQSLVFRLAKLRTIIEIKENPKVPEGTQIKIPDELDPSPVKRSLNIDERSAIPSLDLTALALTNLEE